MNNIVLIGMSGAGKSTLGVLLAKIINKKFIDTDLVLQQKHNNLLHEIINNEGIKKFKTYEENMMLELNVEDTVIATGGSVIYSHLGMNKLKKSGIVIYIHVSFSNIENRLRDITNRGIIMKDGQSLKELYNEREPLYKKYADIRVDVHHESIEETLSTILDKLSQYRSEDKET